jgi:hypothetical protein
MDAYELVEIIRKKPGFYMHGGKSLRQLQAIIIGYEMGARQGISSDFRPFNRWLAQKYGLPEPSGWCNMVISQAGSDEKAFDLFYELLDDFKRVSSSHVTT